MREIRERDKRKKVGFGVACEKGQTRHFDLTFHDSAKIASCDRWGHKRDE